MLVELKLPAQPNLKKDRPKSQYWAFVTDLMFIPIPSLEVTRKLPHVSVRQKWGMQQFCTIEYMDWESELWQTEN